MLIRNRLFIAIALLGSLCLPALAGVPASGTGAAPVVKPPRPDATVVAEMMAQLASPTPGERAPAVAEFRARFTNPPPTASRGSELRLALKALMTAKDYASAADLAQFAIVNIPTDYRTVEAAQQVRVKALLGMQKYPEALANAKSLFNVASMEGTSDAILLCAEALIPARTDDREIYEKFRDEQLAGASTQPSSRPSKPTILSTVQVDPKPYDEVLKNLPGEEYQSLLARGNLLLLADRPKEARVLFERMYTIAAVSQIPEASECLARVMRAEDGTIGRANAWVLSIRPKK